MKKHLLTLILTTLSMASVPLLGVDSRNDIEIALECERAELNRLHAEFLAQHETVQQKERELSKQKREQFYKKFVAPVTSVAKRYSLPVLKFTGAAAAIGGGIFNFGVFFVNGWDWWKLSNTTDISIPKNPVPTDVSRERRNTLVYGGNFAACGLLAYMLIKSGIDDIKAVKQS